MSRIKRKANTFAFYFLLSFIIIFAFDNLKNFNKGSINIFKKNKELVLDKATLPKNIGIIMDGNRRWSKKNGKSLIEGYNEGLKRLEDIVTKSESLGLQNITVYAFSTENWKRPKDEVDTVMNLFYKVLTDNNEKLINNNVRIKFLGRREGMPEKILKKMDEITEKTKNSKAITLTICMNYGGRTELVDAVNKIINTKSKIKEINEENFKNFLYDPNMPDPDFVIRTGGNVRISNFLLWQIAYSELYITELHWPDFNTVEFTKALSEYSKRKRSFGGN